MTKQFLNVFTYEKKIFMNKETVFVNCVLLKDMITPDGEVYKKGDHINSLSMAISYYIFDVKNEYIDELHEIV